MSLEELNARKKTKDLIKLFIKEQLQDFTLDNIIYGTFEYSRIQGWYGYPQTKFIVNNKHTGMKVTYKLKEINKYFDWREAYLEYRKDYLETRGYTKSPDIFTFIETSPFGDTPDKDVSKEVLPIIKKVMKDCERRLNKRLIELRKESSNE